MLMREANSAGISLRGVLGGKDMRMGHGRGWKRQIGIVEFSQEKAATQLWHEQGVGVSLSPSFSIL